MSDHPSHSNRKSLPASLTQSEAQTRPSACGKHCSINVRPKLRTRHDANIQFLTRKVSDAGSAPTAFDDKRDRLALPGIRSTDWLGDSLGRDPGTPGANTGPTRRGRQMHAGVADPDNRWPGPETSRQEREDRKEWPRPRAHEPPKLNLVIIREQTLPPNEKAEPPAASDGRQSIVSRANPRGSCRLAPAIG